MPHGGMEDFDELLKGLAQRAEERRMGVPGPAGGYTLICRDDFINVGAK